MPTYLDLASMLEKINSMLKQIKQLQTESDHMKAELNSIGEHLCDMSRCKRRYTGVKGLDGLTRSSTAMMWCAFATN